ncbi:MAG: 23S rRNA (guanosine(2251)-2'-O)-methyltransferase RlmB [Gammaproteobacteria bacterium]|nr:23S rRNA (guanosine(2251)-2'-O)-methyltransferase RlmB [Gammaproteobacteria bacterium]
MGKGNSVWVVGQHAVSAVLQVNPQRALNLYCVINPDNKEQSAVLSLAQQHGIALHPVTKKELSQRCDSQQHQGLALQCQPRREGNEQELLARLAALPVGRAPLLLVLDQVQDPHNFGACLRSAAAADIDAVVVAKDNASPLTATVQKVASGAAETVAIFRVTNLARTLTQLQQHGVWLVGTSDRADSSLYDVDLTGPTAIVMGAEGKGLRQLTAKKCDTLVSLPMAAGVVSSLNVSVATGVCLFEAVRQRRTS